MKFFAYLLIFMGLCSCVGAACDEKREIASATMPSRSALPITAAKNDDPELFGKLISYQWGRGLLYITAGCVFLIINRKADRINPFSPE